MAPGRGLGFHSGGYCLILRLHMGGCRNYGPFLGTLNIRCRITIGTQKGTIILTTTHIPLHDMKGYRNCEGILGC